MKAEGQGSRKILPRELRAPPPHPALPREAFGNHPLPSLFTLLYKKKEAGRSGHDQGRLVGPSAKGRASGVLPARRYWKKPQASPGAEAGAEGAQPARPAELPRRGARRGPAPGPRPYLMAPRIRHPAPRSLCGRPAALYGLGSGGLRLLSQAPPSPRRCLRQRDECSRLPAPGGHRAPPEHPRSRAAAALKGSPGSASEKDPCPGL